MKDDRGVAQRDGLQVLQSYGGLSRSPVGGVRWMVDGVGQEANPPKLRSVGCGGGRETL